MRCPSSPRSPRPAAHCASRRSTLLRRRTRSLLLAAAAALVSLALPPAPPSPAADDNGLPVEVAAINASWLASVDRATITASPGVLGTPESVFDGNPRTVFRAADPGSAFLEVVFREPREVTAAQILFGDDAPHRWSLLAGDAPGSLVYLFRDVNVNRRSWSEVETLRRPFRARVFRVEASATERTGQGLEFAEVVLTAEQRPESLSWEAPSTVVSRTGPLPVRALVRYDGGLRRSDALGLDVFTEDTTVMTVQRGVHPFDASGITLQVLRTGAARLRARIRGRGVTVEAPPLEVDCVAEGTPDWDVTHIERTPRLPFDGRDGGRVPSGDSHVWVAHVKNYGTADAPRVPFMWGVDGKLHSKGFVESINRFGETTVSLRLPTDGQRHEIRFVVDPESQVTELSEGNNDRAVLSEALLLGAWVERSVMIHFQRTQPAMGDGAAGFEDWLQRQVRRWNGMLRDAVHPTTPRGVTDRVALDLLVVVEDGTLPLGAGLPTNDPDDADRTVDLMRGFPATMLKGDRYRRTGDPAPDNPLRIDGALLRDLSLARSLVDLSPLAVRADEIALRDALGNPVAGGPGMPVDGDGRVYAGSARGILSDAGDLRYDAHSAAALQRIAGRRARTGNRASPPDAGEYLSDLPRSCAIRVVDAAGRPVDGADVRCWRRERGEGGVPVFGGEPVRYVSTAGGGLADLSASGRDPFFEGRSGAGLDVARGVLLLQIRHGGRTCWRFLEVLPFNLAYWAGETTRHTVTVETDLP